MRKEWKNHGHYANPRDMRPGTVFFDSDNWHWVVCSLELLPNGDVKVTATDVVNARRAFTFIPSARVRACPCCTKVERIES